MKRFIFMLIMMTGVALFTIACKNEAYTEGVTTKVYFVDTTLSRLIPYRCEIPPGSAEENARAVLDKLVEGRDSYDKIRRIIPNDKDCMTVSLSGQTAYVDVKSYVAQTVPDSRDFERLFIYQVVDSLTEIKGIRFVRFTVDGEVSRDLCGFCDMRETYKYTYPE